MKQKLVSCIVPVFNSYKTLPACLDSLLASSWKTFEILLVINGSCPEDPILTAKYAAQDSRIKILHSQPAGVSIARNAGLENAAGDYICFCDADDTVSPLWMETLVALIESNNAGYASVLHKDLFFDSQERIQRVQYYYFKKEGLLSRHDYLLEIDGPYSDTTANISVCWQVLYRASVIRQHGVRFPDYPAYYDDIIFNMRYLRHVDTIQVASKHLYHWHRRKNLSGTVLYNPYVLQSAIEVIESTLPLLGSSFTKEEIRHIQHPLASNFIVGALIRLCRTDATIDDATIRQQLTSLIHKSYLPQLLQSYTPRPGQSTELPGLLLSKDTDAIFAYCRQRSQLFMAQRNQ